MNLEPDPAANTVLVLTEPSDTTADLVVKELDHRGARVFRVDTGDFPLSLRVSAWFDGSRPDNFTITITPDGQQVVTLTDTDRSWTLPL